MTLTSEQVDAITHAWLDLAASKMQFNSMDGGIYSMKMLEELAVACKDSVKELEEAFPFLLEEVT